VAYDAGRQQVVLFGGDYAKIQTEDTWTWDGQTWTQQHPTTSPPARYDSSMAYDVGHQQVVLFGGFGAGMMTGDTWTWDGHDWTHANG
jgi:hypothetical protein